MITSTDNEKIRHASMLVKSAKARREEGLFAVEGERIAREIPRGSLKECYISEDFDINGVFSYDVDPVVVSERVFKKMSDTQSPQGILCICRKDTMSVGDLLDSHNDGDLRLLLLESIRDPGNLGTMIRTAEGAGFDAVITDSETVDVYNPKVTRSTMGSLFRVPVIRCADLLHEMDILRERSVKIYAAHLDGQKNYSDIKYGKRIAFLIGNEANGLSDEATQKADVLVKIPMRGRLESLNAAVAAALLMYNCTIG